MLYLGLGIGLFLGALLGVFFMGIFNIAKWGGCDEQFGRI